MADEAFWDDANKHTLEYLAIKATEYEKENECPGLLNAMFGVNTEIREMMQKRVKQINLLAKINEEDVQKTIDSLFDVGSFGPRDIVTKLNSASDVIYDEMAGNPYAFRIKVKHKKSPSLPAGVSSEYKS